MVVIYFLIVRPALLSLISSAYLIRYCPTDLPNLRLPWSLEVSFRSLQWRFLHLRTAGLCQCRSALVDVECHQATSSLLQYLVEILVKCWTWTQPEALCCKQRRPCVYQMVKYQTHLLVVWGKLSLGPSFYDWYFQTNPRLCRGRR